MWLLARLQALGPIISQICEIAGTPGLSLGVLHHGEVVHLANFGVRDVDTHLPPDEHTAYVIGSMTKAITAAMIGILVDEGKLTWTTKLHDIIPTFQRAEYDPANNITITDLLSHRTGLPSYDAYWLLSDNKIPITRADAVPILSHVPIAADLRTEFVYNNMAYEVLGQVIEKVSGANYSTFLTNRILNPLEMTQTFYTTLPSDFKNVAKGYNALQNASVVSVPPPIYGDDVLMGAAGGVRSSVHDLLILYNAFIDAAGSQIQGRTLTIPQNPLRQLDHIFQGKISLPPSTLLEASYASGWGRLQLPLSNKLGYDPPMSTLGVGLPSRLCLHHGGAIFGYLTFTAIFPETGSAVVVLSNSYSLVNAPVLVGHLLIEELFGNTINVTDFTEYAKTAARTNAAAMDNIKIQLIQNRTVEEPANPLQAYVGTYYNSINNFFIEIRQKDGHLAVHFMGLEGFDLEPFQHNSFFWYMSYDELARRARLAGFPMEYYIIEFAHVHGEGNATDDPGSDGINALRWKHEFALKDKGEVFRKRNRLDEPFGQQKG
ncbi:hypothetical protein NUW58_g4220 [Xylaria curta]|uniref:Uncharacterized protein n=1 Tax=Xylaria curta TaxID=42375 RepID=A0ACC1P8A0_9PEZI|nr:hypothetical protein NUW58_g4220 [Xylaria curta]